MILVLALLAYFCLVGLTARRFDTRTRWVLLAGIVALVMLDVVRRTLR
jgi:hypothetical protein